ncbi:MAG: ATP-binding cassette domain-containing protein [Pseudomonadota bacterium]
MKADTSSTAATSLACEGLVRSFGDGEHQVEVLKGIDLHVSRGERLAIIGASGSGKTTLLQLLGGLDTPTHGRVLINGEDVARMGEAARGRWRNAHVGFVYQFHHLLPEFTALENVAMPLLIRRERPSDALVKAQDLLERVGLGARLRHRPSELSGGERQRAAVARALVTSPVVVLADEPTGNLDRPTGRQVFEQMLKLNEDTGASLVVVTHDPELAAAMDRVCRLDEAGLHEEKP